MTVAFTFINLAAAFYFLSADGDPKLVSEKSVREFQRYITFANGKPMVVPQGQTLLKKEKAWIQILDPYGTEVYSLNKPASVPVHYTPGEIVHYHRYDGSIEGTSIYVSWVKQNGVKWSYVIGFSYEKIAKYTVYFSPAKISGFWKEGILAVLGLTLLMVLTIGYFSSRKLTRPLVTIIQGIQVLARGQYEVRYQPKGLYRDVYQSLNQLSDALQENERQRVRLEKMREEWVTNLSHDIKTPLASIKGYGEVLVDPDYEITPDERQKYVDIILGKTQYMEKLLDDLRLTYQLKNNVLPLQKKEGNIVEVIREVVIDVLNTPRYAEREIEFMTDAEYIGFTFDPRFLTRAFTNLIYNAVIHNLPDTRIVIRITEQKEKIGIEVGDNGKGMTAEDVESLFTRYYRGTSTNEQHQGSGLGMAIAKQIIEAHQGNIDVMSQVGKGTNIYVSFLKITDSTKNTKA